MNAIEKLRAKGMNDVAAEFMRNRNELIVARRSLLVSHQINEEYRTKLEALGGKESASEGDGRDENRLIERCAELTQALEALSAQHGEIQDKLAQSNRSLMLAMRTAQEEADARARSEHEKAQLQREIEAQIAQESALQARIEALESALPADVGDVGVVGVAGDAEDAEDEVVPPQEQIKAPEGHEQAARSIIEALELRIEDQRRALEATAVLRSENEALKRQLDELGQQHASLLEKDNHTASERNQTLEHIRDLEAGKAALEQQVSMSMRAMATLQADLDSGRAALSQAQQMQAQGLSRNAELAETIRALNAEKTALQSRALQSEESAQERTLNDVTMPAPEAVYTAATGRSDEDHAAYACASRGVLGALLEETIFSNVLPDAIQMQEIQTFLADENGKRALARLIEIEKGKMTRRILGALAEDDAAS